MGVCVCVCVYSSSPFAVDEWQALSNKIQSQVDSFVNKSPIFTLFFTCTRPLPPKHTYTGMHTCSRFRRSVHIHSHRHTQRHLEMVEKEKLLLLQHTATHCNTHLELGEKMHRASCCNTLQRTTTHCNRHPELLVKMYAHLLLQHNAIHCNALQQTPGVG